MLHNEFIDKVLAYMEEYAPFHSESLVITNQMQGLETKPVESYIEQVLEQACNEMLLTLPLYLINPSSMNIIEHEVLPHGEGKLHLDDSYLRLYCLQLDSFKQPVDIAISDDSPEAVLQYNPYTKGSWVKPVVVYKREPYIDTQNNNKLYHHTLYYYSAAPNDEQHTLKTALQVSRIDPDNIQDSIADMLAINCAIKVAAIYGMSDSVTVLSGLLEGLVKSATL